MEITSVIGVLIVFAIVWTAAFLQLSALSWTVLVGAGLLAVSITGFLSVIPFVILWLLFLGAAAFTHLRKLRQRHVITPALKTLKKQMPSISATERAAIEAGDTWWEKELFCGRPKWKNLFSIPAPALSPDEQHFLDNQVEHLCGMIDDWKSVQETKNLSNEVWDYLKNEKFFGMVIPKQYGGLGFSALAHSTVVVKIATRSISAAVTTMVPNSLGPGELVLKYGTEEQKNYYLPRLANGTEIPCFALTAPDAGSDAGAIPDTGIVCRGQHNGREVLGIRLSWDKRYITLAPLATVLGLAFHLYDPDLLMGDKKDIGITLCLLPTTHPGVEIGNRHLPMNLAFMNGPTRGKDVFIPMDWIIGGEDMAGQGWRMLMECLSIGRSISLPALATASAKKCYRMSGAYARIRRQFNTPISSFEGIEEALGYVSGYTYMLEACRMMTAGAVDQDINPSIVSAMAKYQMTEMCRHVISHAMDVHAGHMIQGGPRNYLTNIYAAIPISITVEGANILTRNLIIFGQGAIRCHPYLLREVELITAQKTDIAELDRVLMAHVGFYISNIFRNLAYGLTGGRLIFATANHRRIKKLQRQLTRMSAALALLADTSLILLGGSLKRRERVSARLGDILSQLYLASTVLKYYQDNNKPSSDVDQVCWALQQCLHKIQIATDELLHNYPHPWLGKILGLLIFPFGTAYRSPQDKLHRHVVSAMLEPSELRDRISRYCYTSKNPQDLACMLDKAITMVTSVEPVQKKLQKAIQNKTIPKWLGFAEQVQIAQQDGIISAEEARLLTQYESLRTDIIKVDEFSYDLDQVLTDSQSGNTTNVSKDNITSFTAFSHSDKEEKI